MPIRLGQTAQCVRRGSMHAGGGVWAVGENGRLIMADNGPPGIADIVQTQQQSYRSREDDCVCPAKPCLSCQSIQHAVEAGWRAALDRLRYLESQGIHVDLHHTGSVGLLEEETLRHMSDENLAKLKAAMSFGRRDLEGDGRPR